MPRKRRHEEPENLDRWLISYADFITLLFAFFVVMYAISSVNEGKYRVLSDTLVSAFNEDPKTLEPIQVGESVQGDQALLPEQARPPSVIDLPEEGSPEGDLQAIADSFERTLQPLIDQELIEIIRNENWVEIEINTSLLFTSGSAELEDEAVPVLQRLADTLARYPNAIQVEGFTDNLPINTYLFPSNWELSAARAASVVHLFMNEGVDPERMAAIGYGEYRPVADNATPEGRRKNRRVVLVIMKGGQERRMLEGSRSGGGGG
ncbi:MAG: flagellar motor protein MotD [Pseudomonadota bacterium]